jgi:hypothetical protein
MLNGGSTPSIQSGLFSARPAVGNAGYLYIATDTQQLFRDSGSAWVLIADGTISGGASTIDGLTDVTVTGAANNQLLRYSSGQWVNWTPTYISNNQSITLSGDITGIGSTTITATLANSGVTAGTYTKLTVNAKGLVTTATSLASSDVTGALGFTPLSNAGGTISTDLVVTGALTVNGGASTTTLSTNGNITLGGSGTVTNLPSPPPSPTSAVSLEYLQAHTLESTGVPTLAAGLVSSRLAAGNAGALYIATDLGLTFRDTGVTWVPLAPPGGVLQTVATTVAATSNTSTLSLTNTVPTTSNGTQIWSLAITPVMATSKIRIAGSLVVSSSSSNRQLIIMIFRGSTCIATTTAYTTTSSSLSSASIHVIDSPASTSTQTYSIRVAITSAATWYVGQTGTAYFGGTLAMNDISVTELA